MNKFKKYCPNTFVAECEEEYSRGDIIVLTTKYGKEVECEVYNLIKKGQNDKFYYSIVRIEDKSYAQRKANKYLGYASNAEKRSNTAYEASKEGADFLALGEPVKVGHHSEKRHRNLIDRNWNRMGKCIEEADKAKEYESKAQYWENKAKEINLSMPESLEYFTNKLEKAKDYHKGLKSGKYPKEHSYSVAYANKTVKELTKKVEIAKKLWGYLNNNKNNDIIIEKKEINLNYTEKELSSFKKGVLF